MIDWLFIFINVESLVILLKPGELAVVLIHRSDSSVDIYKGFSNYFYYIFLMNFLNEIIHLPYLELPIIKFMDICR